jgi:adenine-specific DNA methylase
MEPYYDDGEVKLYLADCRDVVEWWGADFLLTDPPYGRAWKQGNTKTSRQKSSAQVGIQGDDSTEVRDWVLQNWVGKRAAVFGDLMLPPPEGTKQVLIYHKPVDAGLRGATGGFRRDVEAIYLLGGWKSGLAIYDDPSSVLKTRQPMVSGGQGLSHETGHPLAKPIDILQTLIIHAGRPTLVADPFAGSGSTLLAARTLGLQAVGVEVDERYAERAAKRLSQLELL